MSEHTPFNIDMLRTLQVGESLPWEQAPIRTQEPFLQIAVLKSIPASAITPDTEMVPHDEQCEVEKRDFRLSDNKWIRVK